MKEPCHGSGDASDLLRTPTLPRPWTCLACHRHKWGPPAEDYTSKQAWSIAVSKRYRKWGHFCGVECKAEWQARLEGLDRLLASNPRRPPAEIRLFVLERDRFQCYLCGRGVTETSAHIDHVKPWSRGGRTTRDNLRAACRNCNLLKYTSKLPKTVRDILLHGGRIRSPRLRAELEKQFASQPFRRGMTRQEQRFMRESDRLDAEFWAIVGD